MRSSAPPGSIKSNGVSAHHVMNEITTIPIPPLHPRSYEAQVVVNCLNLRTGTNGSQSRICQRALPGMRSLRNGNTNMVSELMRILKEGGCEVG